MTILDSIMKHGANAVVGASTKPNTIGSDLLKRLIEYGFTGQIYPVHRKGGVIEGLQAYPSVCDIPGDVDLAIFVVINVFVLASIDQCLTGRRVCFLMRYSWLSTSGRPSSSLQWRT